MDSASLVADLLQRSGSSKKALCEAAGISRSSLDAYLKGERQPTMGQLRRLGEAAGLRLEVAWASTEVRRDPNWLIADNPAMRPPPLTIEERAQALVRVVAVAMDQRRRARGELEFPPFRSLVRT